MDEGESESAKATETFTDITDEGFSNHGSTSLIGELDLNDDYQDVDEHIEMCRARLRQFQEDRQEIKLALEEATAIKDELVQKIEQCGIGKPTQPLSPAIVKKIFDLEAEVQQLKELNQVKEKCIKSKEEHLKWYKDQLAEQSKESLKNLEKMRQTIWELEDEFDSHRKELKEELDETKSQLEETQATLKAKEAEASSEKKLSSSLKAQLDSLTEEYESLKKELQESPQKITQLENRIASLEEEKGNLQLQLVDFDESKELAVSSQHRVTELEQSLNNYKNSMETLQDKNKQLRRDYEAMNMKVSSQEATIQQLEGYLKKMEEMKIAAEMKCVELEERLEMEREDEEERVKVDKLTKELANCEQTIAEQADTIKALNDKLAADKLALIHIQQNWIDKRDMERVTAQLEDWKNTCTSLEAEVSAVKVERDNLLSQLNQLQLSFEDIQKKCEVMTSGIDTINTDLSNEKFKNTELTKALDLHQEKISSLEAELNKARNEESSAKKPGVMMTSDEKMKKVVASLKVKAKLVKELEAKVEVLNKELEEARTADPNSQEKDLLIQKLTEENASLQAYKLQVENNEVVSTSKVEELLQQVDQGIKVKITLEERNLELERINSASIERTRDLENELEDLKNAYNSTLDQIELLNGELKQIMIQFEARNEELGTAAAERKILLGKIDLLEEHSSDLEKQLNEALMNYSNIKDEIGNKASQVEHLEKELDNTRIQFTDKLEAANKTIVNLEALLREYQTNKPDQDQSGELEELRGKLEELQVSNKSHAVEVAEWKNKYEEKEKDLEETRNRVAELLKASVHDQVEGIVVAAESSVQAKAVDPPQPQPHPQNIQVFKWNESDAPPPTATPALFPDEEDGWGWMASEAQLEHEHSSKLADTEAKLAQIELEKSQLSSQLEETQIKVVKLKKKLKELMVTIEGLRSNKSVDLDQELVEELQAQVDKWQGKNKELQSEIESLKTEKDRLMKRVDTLTSANEQLVEMKERQDIEVCMWQRRSKELEAKVESLQDWDQQEEQPEEASASRVTELLARNQQLEATLATMGTPTNLCQQENIQLKNTIAHLTQQHQAQATQLALSVEQLTAENQRLKAAGPQDHQLSELEAELDQLNTVICELKDSNKQLQKILDSQVATVSQLTKDKAQLESSMSQLEEQVKTLQGTADQVDRLNVDITHERDALRVECTKLSEQLTKASTTNSSLAESIAQLTEDKNSLQAKLALINQEIESLHNSVAFAKITEEHHVLTHQVETLTTKLMDLSQENERLNSELQKLGQDKDSLREQLEAAKEELSQRQSSYHNLQEEYNSLKSELVLLKDSPVQAQVTKVMSSATTLSSSPPVFKGFFDVSQDPFAEVVQSTPDPQILEQLKQKDIELESFRNQVQKMSEEKHLIHTQLTHVVETQRQTFQDQINELTSVIAQKEQEVSQLNATIGELNKRISSMDIAAREQANQTAPELAHLRSTNDFLQQEVSRLNSQLQAEIEKSSKLQEEVNVAQSKLQELEEQSAAQGARLNQDMEAKTEAALTELSSLQQELASLTSALADADHKYSLLEQEKTAVENSLAALREELLAQIDYLNQSVAHKDTVISMQTQHYQALEENMRTLEADAADMAHKLRATEHNFLTFKTALNDKEEQVNQLKHELNIVSQEKKQLESDNNHNKTLLSEAHQELSSLKEELTKVDTGRVGVDSLTNEIQRLNNLIEAKDLEIQTVSDLLTDTRERLMKVGDAQISTEMLSLRTRLDEALYTLHMRDVRCDELTEEIMQLLSERDTLQFRLSEALRLNEQLKSTSETLKSEDSSVLAGQVSSPAAPHKMGDLAKDYRKDPNLQVERQARHSQHMQLYSPPPGTKEDPGPAPDYGILNWFFGSPSSSSKSDPPA